MPNADDPTATPSLTRGLWPRLGAIQGLAFPTALSVIAGMVDLTGFLSFDHVFTAHITGNLVVVAALAGRGEAFRLAPVLLIPMFIVALAAAWGLARVSGWRGVALARGFLWIQFVLLVGVASLSWVKHVSADPQGLMAGLAAMGATSAMACQFALFGLAFPGGPSTAAMTGNLTNAVLSLMARLFPGSSIASPAPGKTKYALYLLAGFVGGCIVAAIAVSKLGDAAWVLPTALAGAVAVLPWDDRGAQAAAPP